MNTIGPVSRRSFNSMGDSLLERDKRPDGVTFIVGVRQFRQTAQ